MNLNDTARLLAVIQVGDNRRVDELTVQEWHYAVGDLRVEDAVEAVRRHRRESTDYLVARHVRDGVTRLRRERLDRTALPEPPVGLGDDPVAYLAWSRSTTQAIADGTYVAPAPAALEARPATMRALGRAFTTPQEARQGTQERRNVPPASTDRRDQTSAPQRAAHRKQQEVA